jgi:hypothetical protein
LVVIENNKKQNRFTILLFFIRLLIT